jgi:hypothetical protein
MFEGNDIAHFEPNGQHHHLEPNREVAGDQGTDSAEAEEPDVYGSFERADDLREEAEGRRARRGRRRGRRGGRRDRETQPVTEVAQGATEPPLEVVTEPSSSVAGGEPRPEVTPRDDTHRADPAPLAPGTAIEGATQVKPFSQDAISAGAIEPAPPEHSVLHHPTLSSPADPDQPRPTPVTSEPVIERVVVRPDAGAEHVVDAPKPVRKGWWQRRFGDA